MTLQRWSKERQHQHVAIAINGRIWCFSSIRWSPQWHPRHEGCLLSSFFFIMGSWVLKSFSFWRESVLFLRFLSFCCSLLLFEREKKLFLGLIGEYFDFSAINSESRLSQPSFNRFLAKSVFKVVLDIVLSRERYSAYTTQLSPVWLYWYFEPCYGAEHCIRKKPMVLGFGYGCEVRVCI